MIRRSNRLGQNSDLADVARCERAGRRTAIADRRLSDIRPSGLDCGRRCILGQVGRHAALAGGAGVIEDATVSVRAAPVLLVLPDDSCALAEFFCVVRATYLVPWVQYAPVILDTDMVVVTLDVSPTVIEGGALRITSAPSFGPPLSKSSISVKALRMPVRLPSMRSSIAAKCDTMAALARTGSRKVRVAARSHSTLCV